MTINNWYLIRALTEFTLYCCLILCGWLLKEEQISYVIILAAFSFVLYIIKDRIASTLRTVEETYIVAEFMAKLDVVCEEMYGRGIVDSLKEWELRKIAKNEPDISKTGA